MPQNIAAKWFALYYPILGFLFILGGSWLIIKREACTKYLISKAEYEQPPTLIRQLLKYFFLFTLPCLLLSYFPFSWPELLFSIWSLFMVYIAGSQLGQWNQTRHTVKNQPAIIKRMVVITGAVMLAVGPVMFLLGYLVIQKLV